MLQSVRYGVKNGAVRHLRYFSGSSIEDKYINTHVKLTYHSNKLSTVIGTEYGLKKFMGKVMGYTSGGVVGSVGVSLLAMPIASHSPLATLGIKQLAEF